MLAENDLNRKLILEKEAAIRKSIRWIAPDATRKDLKQFSEVRRYDDGVEIFRWGKTDLLQFFRPEPVFRGQTLYVKFKVKYLWLTGNEAVREVYL